MVAEAEDTTQGGPSFKVRDPELVRLLDVLVADLEARCKGRKVSREGVVREVLYMALEERSPIRRRILGR